MFESGPTEVLPEVLFLVEKPPAATQEVALVEDQESVEEPPEAMVLGEAVKAAVTAGPGAFASEHEAVDFVPTQSHV